MTYEELKLSKNYEELSLYYYIFNMLDSKVFKLIEKELEPLEIDDSAFCHTYLPRDFKKYEKDEDKSVICCIFKYKDPFKKVTIFQTKGLPVREVKEEWKDCDNIIFEFSPEFYEKVNIKERVDEDNKVVDYFIELKDQNDNIVDFQASKIMKENKQWIDIDDILTNKKETIEKMYKRIMDTHKDK